MRGWVKKVEKINDLSTAEHAFVANNKLGKDQSLLTRNENGEYTYVIGRPAVTVKPKPVKATVKKTVAQEIVAPKIEKKTYETRPIIESEDYVINIAKARKLDLNRPVKNIRGVRIIEAPEISSKIMISKPDEKGRHYVMVKTKDMPNDRLVVNSQGKYLYSMNSNEDAALFDKKFQSLLEPKS